MRTLDMILLPPAPPITATSSSDLDTTIEGIIEDLGLLPGAMSLFLPGARLKEFGLFGIEKSSIRLLNMIPVRP